jgi:hypothetical protein
LVWKTVNNSDAGTGTKHGGNDIDKITTAFNGNSVSDPIIYRVDFNTLKDSTNAAGDLLKGNGTKYVRFPRGAAGQVLAVNSGGTDLEWSSAAGGGATVLDGLTDVAITSAARGNILVRDATQWINKAKGTAGQVLTMDGTGTDPIWATPAAGGGPGYVSSFWRMYVDSADSKIKATNGTTTITNGTGAGDTDAGEVIMDVFDSVGSSAFFSIYVDPGTYTIRSWDETRTRRGNFSIIGSGQGLTKFVAMNNLADGTDVMAFEAADGSTTTNLTANCTKGSPSISVTSVTGFAVGDDIILCSDEDWDAVFAAADKTQLNRIVSISGTTIMLEKFAAETFNTANTARIIKQTMLRNIYLADFSIEADSAMTTQPVFLRLEFCDMLTAENIAIRNPIGDFHKAVVTNMVTNSILRNFVMEYKRTAHFTTSGPYAISCRAACDNVTYENFQFIGGWRHCFTTTTSQTGVRDGVPKDIFVVNCSSDGCSEASYDTHGEGENIFFINCSANGYRSADSTDTVAGTADTDAFALRNKHTYIINPMVTNSRGRAIAITSTGYGHKVQGGFIRYLRNNQRAIDIETGCHDVQISGVNIDTVAKEGILIGDGCYNIQISDCKISNTCTDGGAISPIDGDPNSHDVILNNLIIDTSNDSALAAIRLSSTTSNYTLSNITLIGSGADSFLNGFNHKLNHLTCFGRNLERPLRKIGYWSGTSSNNGASGLLQGILTNAGGSKRIETTDGTFQEFATSTLNTVQGIKCSNFTERDLNPYARFVFRAENNTLMRVFMMFSSSDSAVGPAGADPLANNSGIGLKLASSGTHFVIYHNSGDATSTTGANILAVDTNKHVFEVRADNANSKFQYRLDYGSWVDISTDIPAATTDLCIQAYMENDETAVTKTMNLLEVEVSQDNK